MELPFAHPIYHQKYNFSNGLPKIHEHDGKPPQGFGLLWQGRLVCYYDFETDLGDGWDDVHNDPTELRNKALQMGANLVQPYFHNGACETLACVVNHAAWRYSVRLLKRVVVPIPVEEPRLVRFACQTCPF